MSTYGVSGKEYVAGLELIPGGDHEQSADFKIMVGGKQLSVCSDVSGATKCAGGGKSNVPLFYTYSNEKYIHSSFNEIVEINK